MQYPLTALLGGFAMEVSLRLAFDEDALTRLLNFIARENYLIIKGKPDLPALYSSGIYYRREQREVWCDYLNMLLRGYEDCDALAAARAGELMARGAAALSPKDGGYMRARELRLREIPAEVYITTRVKPGERGGLYHCVVRYFVDGEWHKDDPSARLGMNDGKPWKKRKAWVARQAEAHRRRSANG